MKHLALVAAALAVSVLSGCASAPAQQSALGEHCTLAVRADIGMGVQQNRCVAWTFGPSRMQREAFDKRAASK